jgi:hypothetical protein
MLAIALTLTGVIVLITAARRITFPRWAIIGILLLAISAGAPVWHRSQIDTVTVIVDLSASTRGAAYRNQQTLNNRLAESLGKTPYRIVTLTGDDRTTFEPPLTAGPVLLFSDGRFDPPVSAASAVGFPPIFPVLDPLLESPDDAAINRLEIRADRLAVIVTNSGKPRQMSFSGVTGDRHATIASGTFTIERQLAPGETEASAELQFGDLWPENDRLSIRLPPTLVAERWWVATSPPPSPQWRGFTPHLLPTDPAAWLAPSVVVLDNVPADAMTATGQDRLRQYVRDLGGSLIILGGDRAFAMGNYDGTPLDALSPLASSPPTPSVRWILLVDASGSMSGDAGGVSRWDRAVAAIVGVLGRLPPDDPAQVGQFSDAVRWWPVGKNARETAAMTLPLPDASPHGPTNLERALNDIAAEATSEKDSMPRQLLVLTDAGAPIADPSAIASAMKSHDIHLHVLAIGDGEGLQALRQITDAAGGSVITQLDPSAWAESARDVLRAAMPERFVRTPLAVQFAGPAASVGSIATPTWNRTWMKQGAESWAADNHAAAWQAGQGRVVAVSFQPDMKTATALADLVAQTPRDPRLKVAWDCGPTIRVTVDAVERGDYLNGMDLSLTLIDEAGAVKTEAIPQIGPGRYEVAMDAPRRPTLATIRANGRLIDRHAIAGRYAPEFNAVGTDHASLSALADATGGRVIPPTQTTPIAFDWPKKDVPLTPWLATAGAAILAASMVVWTRRR